MQTQYLHLIFIGNLPDLIASLQRNHPELRRQLQDTLSILRYFYPPLMFQLRSLKNYFTITTPKINPAPNLNKVVS